MNPRARLGRMAAPKLRAQRKPAVPFRLIRKGLPGANFAAFVTLAEKSKSIKLGKIGFDVITAYKKVGLPRAVAVQVEIDRLRAMKQSVRGDPGFLKLNFSESAIRELAKQNIARVYGK